MNHIYNGMCVNDLPRVATRWHIYVAIVRDPHVKFFFKITEKKSWIHIYKSYTVTAWKQNCWKSNLHDYASSVLCITPSWMLIMNKSIMRLMLAWHVATHFYALVAAFTMYALLLWLLTLLSLDVDESLHKGSHAIFVRSLLVDEERNWPVGDFSWLGSAHRLSFSALILLVGWLEGQCVHKKTCVTYS